MNGMEMGNRDADGNEITDVDADGGRDGGRDGDAAAPRRLPAGAAAGVRRGGAGGGPAPPAAVSVPMVTLPVGAESGSVAVPGAPGRAGPGEPGMLRGCGPRP